MVKSNKRIKKLKRNTKAKRISYKKKSRKLIRKKMRKSVNKKRTKVGGTRGARGVFNHITVPAKTRKQTKGSFIPRITTVNAQTQAFSKVSDSPGAIEDIISTAINKLNTDRRVIISIVWPNNSYPDGDKGSPHQAHTFAISIDMEKSTLILFDNDGNNKYLSSGDEARNYIKIINDIIKKFNIGNILFFQDEDWCGRKNKKIENIETYNEQVRLENQAGEGKGEGGCQAHTAALDTLNLIKVFSEYTPEEKERYLIDEKDKAYVSDGKEEKRMSYGR